MKMIKMSEIHSCVRESLDKEISCLVWAYYKGFNGTVERVLPRLSLWRVDEDKYIIQSEVVMPTGATARLDIRQVDSGSLYQAEDAFCKRLHHLQKFIGDSYEIRGGIDYGEFNK